MDPYVQLWAGSMLCIGLASILVGFIIKPPKERHVMRIEPRVREEEIRGGEI